MTTGTGLAIIAVWIPVLGAMLAKEVTELGLRRSQRTAILLTIGILAYARLA